MCKVLYLPLLLGQTGKCNQFRPRMDALAASDLGLHCLPFIQQFLETLTGTIINVLKLTCLKFRRCMRRNLKDVPDISINTVI